MTECVPPAGGPQSGRHTSHTSFIRNVDFAPVFHITSLQGNTVAMFLSHDINK